MSTTAPDCDTTSRLLFGTPVTIPYGPNTRHQRRRLGVVRRRLPNNRYEIQYQQEEYDLPIGIKHKDDLEVGWNHYLPNNLGEVPRQLFNDDRRKKMKRKTPPDVIHDPDWSNCRTWSHIDDNNDEKRFDIAKALRHHAPNGEVVADLYTNSVLNEGSREAHIANSTFDLKQAIVHGHRYTRLQKGYEHARRDYGGICSCKGCKARFRYQGDDHITTLEGKHSSYCMMKQFLNNEDFTREQKEPVVLEFVRRVETIVDTTGKLVSQ